MAAAVRSVIGSCQIREEGAVESQGAHGTDEAGCYARLRYAAAISAISELQRVSLPVHGFLGHLIGAGCPCGGGIHDRLSGGNERA